VQKDCCNWALLAIHTSAPTSPDAVIPLGDFKLPTARLVHTHKETNRSADKCKSTVDENPTAPQTATSLPVTRTTRSGQVHFPARFNI
jgi:hypothetical protein